MSVLYKLQSILARLLKIPNSELSIYIDHFKLPNTKTKKVLIFAQGRSGSTLLENLLASTGHFKELGELFAPERPVERKFPFYFLSGLSKKSGNITCHIKIYHFTRDRKRNINTHKFLKKLVQQGWYIIFLDRTNKFQQALSNEVAEAREGYHKVNDENEQLEITINCDNLKNHILQRINWRKEEIDVLHGIKFYYVNYENDLMDAGKHEQTVNRILEYTGLSERKCYTKYRKINVYKPDEIITNYNEVKKMLTEIDYNIKNVPAYK